MSHIRGIGGVFLHARDPRALADWYADTLGIEIIAYEEGANYAHEFGWDAEHDFTRNTTWAILQATDEQAEATPRTVVNYHVHDLGALLDTLREKGVAVDKTEDYDYGRFAWITDPEGYRIELYQALFGTADEMQNAA